MYNEDIKRNFLDTECSSLKKQRDIAKVFSSIASFEQENGLDIAEMGKNLSAQALERTGINEYSGIRSYITRLREYARWCEKNNIFPSIPGGIFEVSPDDVDITDSLKGVLFKDEFDLLESIRLVRDFDSGYPEVAAFCLYWVGLTKDEAVLLKDTDVDLENKIVYVHDGIVAEDFSDAICDVLNRYRNCKWSTRANGTTLMSVRKDLSVDTFLKRMLTDGSKKFGKPVTKEQIATLCQDVVTDCLALGFPSRHTFQNVWRCGGFNRMYKLEQSGVDVMNRPTIETVFRGKKSYYDTLRMYQYYKKVFGL